MKFTLKKKLPHRQPGAVVGKRLRDGAATISLPFDKEEEGEKRGDPAEDAVLPSGRQKKRVVEGRVSDSGDGPENEDELAERRRLAQAFQEQGDRLAEDGKYREALAKWEAALIVMPGNIVLHEQKAQVLLEVGNAWGAIKAATRATELDPSWAEAWITLGRAQLNYGEPDASIESFDKALTIAPNSEEAKADRETARFLVKKRKQLHSSGLCEVESRFIVRDNDETP